MTTHIQIAGTPNRGPHLAGRKGLYVVIAVAAVFRYMVLSLLFLVSSLDVCAQTASTGALAGIVTDPSGAAVQNAKITLRNSGTNSTRTTTTGQDGFYRFSLVVAGEYELTVEAANFKPAVLRNVRIEITEAPNIATQLVLKGAIQEVVVRAPRLQTENAALGSVIGQGTIRTLPLVNRNYTQILGLTAGTNTDVVDATLLGAGSQEIRANGARSGDNNFMLNGVDANSYGSNMTEATNNSGGGIAIPAPDTLEEFKVQDSLYDAQYGRGGGANVLVETKSGTAQFHGDAYYFGRNEALNANNFFADSTGVPKGEFRRQQPGVTLGGPIPWSGKRTFFFVSYQATRDVNAASLASSVESLRLPPLPGVRTAAALGATFGGQTGVFGGAAIARDGSNINPVAVNLLNAKNPDGSFVIPSPQIVASGVNYTAVRSGRNHDDQFNTNVDRTLSTSDQLSAKFFFSNSDVNVPFSGATIPGFPALRSFDNRHLAVAYTHTFSARWVNQFRASFSRIASRSAAPSPLTAQSVGITRDDDATLRSLPHIQIQGAFQIGNSANDKNETKNDNLYFSDTVSLSRGRHNVRAGAEIFHNRFINAPDNTDGSLLFLSFPDFLLGLPAGPVSAGGNGTPLSNVYLAQASAIVPHSDLRSKAAHFYAVDDWKISPAVSINLGFRLEANGQQSEAHGEIANFDPKFYVPPLPGGFTNPSTSGFVLPDNYNGPAPQGFPRSNSTLVNDPVQVHIEPRIGLAWRPFSSRDFVVRTGYGLYANRISFFGYGIGLAFNPPFQENRSLIGAANAESSLQRPFPILPKLSAFPKFAMLPGPPYTGDHVPLLAITVDPNFRDATIQHYGVDIQYEHKSFLFSLAYAGATGRDLAVSRSNNQPALASPTSPVNGLITNSVANAAERVPYPGLAPLVFNVASSGTSRYDSLQATVNKRLSHGLQLLAAYTLSKSVDTGADSLGSAAFGQYGAPIFGEQVFNDQNDIHAQRGPSDFDRRHRFVFSYIWQLPEPDRHRHPLAILAEGWAFSGVVTVQSGLPFSVLDSAAGTLFGPATYFTTGSLAPGATLQGAGRNGSVSSRINEFFNTSMFAPAPFIPDRNLIAGQFPVSGGGTIFGNLGRNILRGPDQQNADAAIIKRTRLSEKTSMVFRWEVFNLLNHPNFANPAADVATPATFGRISAMSVNPRIMQYGLKFEF